MVKQAKPLYALPELERVKLALRFEGQIVKVTMKPVRTRESDAYLAYGEVLGVAESQHGTTGYGLVLKRPRDSATLIFVRLSIVQSIGNPTEEEWRLACS